jgi:hypothetical protein
MPLIFEYHKLPILIRFIRTFAIFVLKALDFTNVLREAENRFNSQTSTYTTFVPTSPR